MSSKGNDEQQPQAEAIHLEPVFERLAGVAPTILYVFDLERMANVWANQSLFDYLGYRDSDVQQMGSDLLPKLMHPDDLARYEAHFEHLVALKDGVRAEFQYRMRHGDGQWIWLHSNETVHARGADGAVTQIVGSAHDITELKNTTAELELVSSELRHRVANIFAVITAITSITARVHPESSEVLSDLGERIMALSYAHEVTLNSEHRSSVDLAELVGRVLHPFEGAAPIRAEFQDGLLLEDLQASPLG